MRQTGVARFAVPRRLSDDELIHPYLAPAAAVMAHWNDRLSFHAGAFCLEGRVWGILGDREAGKSSMLAALAALGQPIVTDDVLVVSNAIAFAGPRSIDLREEAASRLDLGVPLGIVGKRPRWRVSLPPMVAEGSLAGWILLEWSDTVEAIPMPPSQRLSRLIEHRALRAAPMTPTALLELAALPAWTLKRPRDWRHLTAATTKLLDVTSGSR